MRAMRSIALAGLLLSGCGQGSDQASDTAAEPAAVTGQDSPSPPGGTPPEGPPSVPAAASTAPTPAPTPKLRRWTSPDGAITLRYPASLTPGQDFAGTYFTPAGWRAMFDGADAGPGQGLVRFTGTGISSARSDTSGNGAPAPRIVTDSLQIGRSTDASVIADCRTRGLQGGNAAPRPDRMVGGVRFTVTGNGDAGMSHQLTSTHYRAVHNGQCIAIDRLTSAVPASVDSEARPTRSSAAVAQDLDQLLESVRFAAPAQP